MPSNCFFLRKFKKMILHHKQLNISLYVQYIPQKSYAYKTFFFKKFNFYDLIAKKRIINVNIFLGYKYYVKFTYKCTADMYSLRLRSTYSFIVDFKKRCFQYMIYVLSIFYQLEEVQKRPED